MFFGSLLAPILASFGLPDAPWGAPWAPRRRFGELFFSTCVKWLGEEALRSGSGAHHASDTLSPGGVEDSYGALWDPPCIDQKESNLPHTPDDPKGSVDWLLGYLVIGGLVESWHRESPTSSDR